MLTTSEIAATITIWGLTATGIFFGARATLRKKRIKHGILETRIDIREETDDAAHDR